MVLGNFGVTLMGFSYMDLISGFVGTYFYQLVWNALHACGLTVLPFVVVMVNALRENFENDQVNDQPHQQVGRVITKLAVMVCVMIFAAAPTIKVNDIAVRMQLRTCDKLEIVSDEPAKTELVGTLTNGKTYILSVSEFLSLQESMETMSEKNTLERITTQFTMGGEVLRIPIWWYTWRQIMLGTGTMITAELPCDNGLRALRNNLSSHFITDVALADEVGMFMAQCTVPAMAKNQKLIGGGALTPEAMLPNYPFYLGTEAFYPSIRSVKPVWGFGMLEGEKGYDSVKAPKSSNPSGTLDGYGYPLCDAWWSDSAMIISKDIPGLESRKVFRGLEERLFEYYGLKDPEKCTDFLDILGFSGSATCDGVNGVSQSAVLTGVLKEQLQGQSAAAMEAKKILSKHMGRQALLGSNDSTAEGNAFFEGVLGQMMDVGLWTSAFKDFSGNLGLLKAMPIATSLLILIVTAILPIGMIVGRYELEPLMGLTVTYAGFFLWIPYFRMIRWLDDHFVTMVVSQYQLNTVIMLEMMISVGYIAIPLILGSVITIAGVRIAQLDPVGGDKMGSIANKGATTAQNAISSGAGKAKAAAKGK